MRSISNRSSTGFLVNIVCVCAVVHAAAGAVRLFVVVFIGGDSRCRRWHRQRVVPGDRMLFVLSTRIVGRFSVQWDGGGDAVVSAVHIVLSSLGDVVVVTAVGWQ